MNRHPDLAPLDPELAALVTVERASAAGPSAAQRARLGARLAASLALPAAAGVAASSPTAAAATVGGTTTLVKPAAVLALALAVGAGAVVAVHDATTPRRAPATIAPTVAPRPATAPAPDPAVSVRDERRLVQEAWTALAARRAGVALDRLEEHARRFPRGLLVEEREALRVQALAAAGRAGEARAAALRFQTTYPHSVHRAAVRAATSPPGQ